LYAVLPVAELLPSITWITCTRPCSGVSHGSLRWVSPFHIWFVSSPPTAVLSIIFPAPFRPFVLPRPLGVAPCALDLRAPSPSSSPSSQRASHISAQCGSLPLALALGPFIACSTTVAYTAQNLP
jgi:hypothetical protein